jgi:hypothetical protein
MNSQRRWLPRPGTTVAGRAGSHIITDRRWRSASAGTPAIGGNVTGPSTSASTTSQGSSKSRSSSAMPSALRTGLRAPSVAITQRAARVWLAPSWS